MLHTFDRAGVDRLIAHTKAAPKHNKTYGQAEDPGPGLWLAGDHGVYLLSNGAPPLLRVPTLEEQAQDARTKRPNKRHFVVYAHEVDPTQLAFDVWWAAKEEGFGPDDGVEFLPLATIEKALAGSKPTAPLLIDLSSSGMAILRSRTASTPKPKPARKSPAAKRH